MKTILLSILVLMISPSVMAQDLDGSWNANIETPRGPVDRVFNFTTEANRITGTMEGSREGEMLAVYKASIDGNTFNLVKTFEGEILSGTPARQELDAS